MNLSMVALSTSRSTVAAAAASEVKRVFHLLNPVFEVRMIDPVLCLAETRRKRYLFALLSKGSYPNSSQTNSAGFVYRNMALAKVPSAFEP